MQWGACDTTMSAADAANTAHDFALRHESAVVHQPHRQLSPGAATSDQTSSQC
jgi:hypothetical protein